MHSDVAPYGRSDVMCSASSRAKRTSLAKQTSRPKGTSRSAKAEHIVEKALLLQKATGGLCVIFQTSWRAAWRYRERADRGVGGSVMTRPFLITPLSPWKCFPATARRISTRRLQTAAPAFYRCRD